MENGITYRVRPCMEPRNRSVSVARISSGSRQLLVGPASTASREQMYVRSSTRATSDGSERARKLFGRFSADSRVKVPASTSPSQSAWYSASEPSHQWIAVGSGQGGDLVDPAHQVGNAVGAPHPRIPRHPRSCLQRAHGRSPIVCRPNAGPARARARRTALADNHSGSPRPKCDWCAHRAAQRESAGREALAEPGVPSPVSMSVPPRPAVPSRRHDPPPRQPGLRALLAGIVLLGAIGSCELPKPNIPSIGATPAGPSVVTRI